ncbi:hypothetical protein [Rhodopirellula halodulae]|uniref:hypothetical protein n=1 Tax=Rhodopirellula halodulae TaxID=2894198 RepID=UPI001E4BE40D|nr:hypothetical protein [Rhodopirellula sp. JC737]MCC9656125.1 hypothetical protein [Rhodopirellula sp. JC737]
MQSSEESSRSTSKPDWGYRLLMSVAVLVAGWLLLMPWCPPIIHSTMNRFHLRTPSFVQWAVQTPIPAMYNFKNTTEVRDLPPQDELSGLVDPFWLTPLEETSDELGVVASRTINHYPTREFTFANGRVRYLQEDADRWLVIESHYRGEFLQSTYQLSRDEAGVWQMVLREEDRP